MYNINIKLKPFETY